MMLRRLAALRHFAFVLAVAGLLAACQTTDTGDKEAVGTLVGAGLGGLLGAQVGSGSGQLAATAFGALAGAYVGNNIGQSLDRADQAFMRQTAFNSFERSPTGHVSQWKNPDSGHSGTVTPTRTFKSAQGQNCRDFETTINVDGQVQVGSGTACRQADGTWRIVQ